MIRKRDFGGGGGGGGGRVFFLVMAFAYNSIARGGDEIGGFAFGGRLGQA